MTDTGNPSHILEEILKELRELGGWMRFRGLVALRPLLETSLRTDKQGLVYENSDGVRPSREVARLSGVSPGLVSELWNEWARAGLVVESRDNPGRWGHLVSLSDLGLRTGSGQEGGRDVGKD